MERKLARRALPTLGGGIPFARTARPRRSADDRSDELRPTVTANRSPAGIQPDAELPPPVDQHADTTVTRIAERAGVTKITFFRYFSDKRELLVAGQETLSRLPADGITEAPASAGPLQAVAAGLERASSAMGPANRELGPRLKAAVAASTEPQERDALKSVGLAAAMPSGPKVIVMTRKASRHVRWQPWKTCVRQLHRWADRCRSAVADRVR